MSLVDILRKSMNELQESPIYFIPRLISTSISSAWFLYMVQMPDPETYLLTAPLIIFMGLFVPVMVAYMVENDGGLAEGFRATLKRSDKVLGSTAAFFLAGAFTAIPTALGLLIFQISGSLTALALGLLLSIAAILLTGFASYFLPITLIRNGVIDGFRESASFSSENRREVTALMVFSFLLFGVSAASSGVMQALGTLGFILGRLTSALVGTYLIVVSPKYYLEKEKEDEE